MKTKTWEDEDYTYTVRDHDKQITGNGWETCLREKQWVPIGRIFIAGIVYRKKKRKFRIPTVTDIRASGYELKCSNNHHTLHIITWYYISSGLCGVSSGGGTYLMSKLTIPNVPRPRADKGCRFYYVDAEGIIPDTDDNVDFDQAHYAVGNYYLDESIAKKAQRYLRGE